MSVFSTTRAFTAIAFSGSEYRQNVFSSLSHPPDIFTNPLVFNPNILRNISIYPTLSENYNAGIASKQFFFVLRCLAITDINLEIAWPLSHHPQYWKADVAAFKDELRCFREVGFRRVKIIVAVRVSSQPKFLVKSISSMQSEAQGFAQKVLGGGGSVEWGGWELDVEGFEVAVRRVGGVVERKG